MKINLPYWPKERLVREAIFNWNIRHGRGKEEIDIDESSWPKIRVAVLTFLRHRLTDYDLELSRLSRHDAQVRNDLVAAVEAKARIIYPWLAKDPRPFPEAPPLRPFDEQAAAMGHYQTCLAHLTTALGEAKRLGDKVWMKDLQESITHCRTKFDRLYKVLSTPKHEPDPDGHGGFSNGFQVVIRPICGQYIIPGIERPVYPNEYHYLGFRCPGCQAPVIKMKRKLNLGQGNIVEMTACFCFSYALNVPPPGYHLSTATLQQWTILEAKRTERLKCLKS